MDWTIQADEKTILGYTCQRVLGKACDGQEITVVWFTPDIPLPNGPKQYEYGGMPGLILEVQLDSSRLIRATRIQSHPDCAVDFENIRQQANQGKSVTFD